MFQAIKVIVRYFGMTRVNYIHAKADAYEFKHELRRSRRRVIELENKVDTLSEECDGLRRELADSAVAAEAVTPD